MDNTFILPNKAVRKSRYRKGYIKKQAKNIDRKEHENNKNVSFNQIDYVGVTYENYNRKSYKKNKEVDKVWFSGRTKANTKFNKFLVEGVEGVEGNSMNVNIVFEDEIETKKDTENQTENGDKSVSAEEFEKQLKEGEENENRQEDEIFVVEGELDTKEIKIEETWLSSDRDYTYQELLGRVFQTLRQNNPELAGEKKRYTIVPPSVHREGNKKTIFANVADICKRMHRQPEHVIQFLFTELGTSGSIDGSQRLVIKGRFQQKQIENVLRRYIVEYVTCKTCKSPDTILTKENRIFFQQCESCGSTRSVSAIKSASISSILSFNKFEACLQFNPKIGEVERNQNFASSILEKYQPEDIDILILPELAFTGYVFNDKDHIKPYLEDSETGTSVKWAKAQSIRLRAFTVVGYPQIVKGNPDKCYNSLCFVNPYGELIETYQKTHLYETDESWAEEGPGFKSINVPGLGKIGFGICMDLNPYQFKASFTKYEFARYHIQHQTEIILCPMAWIRSEYSQQINVDKPEYRTVNYWCDRLSPYLTNSGPKRNTLFVACNRTGIENGICFAGSSSVLLLSSEHPIVLDSLKSNEEAVMVVDVPRL
ncbi:2459_t:CDS:10 [Funneliformis mosseae]|uniref:2459_t:CDS:1 n=1 Tax=Funneliformis mosseae TaxID=27381 RepID=A0A9N8YQJ6_FUNMO|nr:2459_t:CDS:10 [Funneliformis mosseae]